jgi:hypothetical protein
MLRKLTILYLIVVVAYAWGFSAMRYNFFPAKQFAALEQGLKSLFRDEPQPAATRSAERPVSAEKLLKHQLVDLSISGLREYGDMEIPGLDSRRKNPLLYTATGIANGYRLIFGSFDFSDNIHGAVLLGPDQHTIHRWVIPESEIVKQGGNGPNDRLPRGIAVFENGSIVVSDDNRGTGLYRFDVCGNLEWFAPGRFNDVVQVAAGGEQVWSLEDESMIALDAMSGERLRTITLNDIHLANPDIAVFTPRRSLRVSKWYHDPVHASDVEPLGRRLAHKFSQFKAGDLLVSYRSLNLILVIDPETLKIKWWRTGVSQRQTDVDWNLDGTISIYNNNRRDNRENWDGNLPDESTRYSGIVSIEPSTMDFANVFDGAGNNIYSASHGKHQQIPGGNILITSPDQGRAVEVTADGTVVFDFVNRFSQSQALRISESKWLPTDFFSIDISGGNLCPESN